mgnify:FL=1
MSHCLETWRTVGVNPLYEVSNLGRVRRGDTVLPQHNESKGYLQVSLYMAIRKHKKFLVHRLVAEAFIPSVAGKSQVNHINGTKSDNRAENLEWCDQSHNIRHAMSLGLYPLLCNGTSPNAKLTPEQVAEIRGRDYRHGLYRQWAQEFGVKESAISKVHQGKTFKGN